MSASSAFPEPTFNATLPDESDEPFHVDLTQSLIILFAPFVLTPLLIVFFRIIKFSYKIYKASLSGNGAFGGCTLGE